MTIMSKRWHPTPGSALKKLASSPGYCDSNSLRDDGSTATKSTISSPFLSTGTRAKRVKIEFSPSVVDVAGGGDSTVSPKSSASSRTVESKPETTRIILERDPMTKLMESHIFCPLCANAVVVSFPSIGIASGCRIQCSKQLCTYVHIERPKTCDVDLPEGSGSPLIERTTDYPANVLYILAFLACGDGGKEAERILGFLGLPNSSTMEKRTFPVIEERLSATIQGVTN